MTCPPGLAPIIAGLIEVGLLRVRALAWSGNLVRCATEADHIHNLPKLLTNYSFDRLEFYWEKERPQYLDRGTSDGLKNWEDLWSALRVQIETIRSSRPVRDTGPGRGRDEPLYDEEGLIPTFPPASVDENGKYVLPTEAENRARSKAMIRVLDVLDSMTDETDEDAEARRELFRYLNITMDSEVAGKGA